MYSLKPNTFAWLILFFAATNVIFLGGKRRAFGGFIAALHKEYSNITLTELNWIGDSYSALGSMSTMLTTAIIVFFNRRYAVFQLIGSVLILVSCVTSAFIPNPHWLFLSHTLFHGIGSSIVLSVAGLIVMEYFDSNHPYRILATTLLSGGSIATIVFVSSFAYVIQQFKWRMAFIIIGSIYFIIHFSAVIVYRRNEDVTKLDIKKFKFQCNIRATQIPLLALWFLDKVLNGVVLYGLLLNLTDYLYRVQPNLVDSSLLTTLFASGEAVAFLIIAIMTATTKTFLKGKLGYVLVISSMMSASSMIVMEFTTSNKLLQIILCFTSGFGVGFSNTLVFPAAEELTKLPGYIAYPYSLMGVGFGMLISPLLTAKIAEVFRYKWFFFVQGLLVLMKSLSIVTILIILYYYRKNNVNIKYEGKSSNKGDPVDQEVSDYVIK